MLFYIFIEHDRVIEDQIFSQRTLCEEKHFSQRAPKIKKIISEL